MKSKLDREELAAIEVGRTLISSQLAKWITVLFLLLIFIVPLYQILFDEFRRPSAIHFKKQGILSLTGLVTKWNNQILKRIDDIETELEEQSFLRTLVLATGQKILLSFGYGNEKVYPGRDDWLFFRPDMDYLIGAPFLDPVQIERRRKSGNLWEDKIQPDPLRAIKQFKQQLDDRGIELVLLPVPVKPSLHPEKFYGGVIDSPLQNRSWEMFLQMLEQEGIVLFDPGPALTVYRTQQSVPLYLQTDTHWRPEAMAKTAKDLAEFITKSITLTGKTSILEQTSEIVTNRGDIDAMLLLPENANPFSRETVTIYPIVNKKGELWQSDIHAEILLLGDSFSNIYSLSGMGWGAGSGFAEQLSFFLQRPLDAILQNDSAAFATREILSKDLAAGRDRLQWKKIVIWQFSARELSYGDWKIISMELKERHESNFYTPPPNEIKEVTALVNSISPSPLPGSVPYKDNILTLHLSEIRDKQTREEYGQALVYAWGMQNNTVMPMAKIRAGTRIDLKLIDWDSVQKQYSSYRRSTLADEMIELELPVWGELIE